VHRNPEQSAEISDLPCILLPLEKHIIRTAIGTHSRFTRQGQSYAEWPAVARKTFALAKCPGIAPTRPTVVRLRGPLPDWKRPAAEWPSKASQINPLAGVELQIPACICCGCILFRIEY
jgi:hypothetical protein